MAVEIGEVLIKLGATVASLQADMKKAIGVLNRSEKTIEQIGTNIGRVIAGAFSIVAVKKFANTIADLAERGEKFGSIASAFEKLGGTSPNIDLAAKATGNLVSKFDLMQIATKGLVANVPAVNKNLVELSKLGAQAADALGIETKDAIDDLVQSLIKGKSVGFVKQLGIEIPTIEAFRAKFAELPPVTTSFANQIQSLRTQLSDNITQIGININENERLQNAFASLTSILQNIDWQRVADALATISAQALIAADNITAFIAEMISVVVDGWKTMTATLEELGVFIADTVTAMIESWQLFWAEFDTGIIAINKFVDDSLAMFSKLKNEAISSIEDMVNSISDWLGDKLNTVTDTVKNTLDSVKGYFEELGKVLVFQSIVPDMVNAILGWFDKLGSGMVSTTNTATNSVQRNVASMEDSLGGFASATISLGNTFEDVFGLKIPDGVKKALDFINTLADAIRDLKEVFDTVSQIFGVISGNPVPPSSSGGGQIPDSGIIGDIIGVISGGGGAIGDVIGSIGGVFGFAKGGVFDSPTVFKHGGGLGLMGEAGPEAILPLTNIGGKLGVLSSGGSSGMQIFIDARGAAPGVENQIMSALSQIKTEAIEESVRAVTRLRGGGGSFNSVWDQ